MTCIVGLEADGKVYMGGDSASTSDWDVNISPVHKVFLNGDFLIGTTGIWRLPQLLQYSLGVRPQEEDESDMQYMVTGFVEAVRKCLKEGGFAKVQNEQEEGDGTILVGFSGRVYKVYKRYSVCVSSDCFQAIGCGDEYALGNLWSTRGCNMKPEERILAALEAAGHFSNGVCPPYYVEQLDFGGTECKPH